MIIIIYNSCGAILGNQTLYALQIEQKVDKSENLLDELLLIAFLI